MDPEKTLEWIEFRNEAYKLAYESAKKHFEGRYATPSEYAAYQNAFVRAYFEQPKKPTRPLAR